jgi:hypothetical protein
MLSVPIIALIGFKTVYEPTKPRIFSYTNNTLIRTVPRGGFKPLKLGWCGRFYPANNGMYPANKNRCLLFQRPEYESPATATIRFDIPA